MWVCVYVYTCHSTGVTEDIPEEPFAPFIMRVLGITLGSLDMVVSTSPSVLCSGPELDLKQGTKCFAEELGVHSDGLRSTSAYDFTWGYRCKCVVYVSSRAGGTVCVTAWVKIFVSGFGWV